MSVIAEKVMQLVCRGCGSGFEHHRKKAYCSSKCRAKRRRPKGGDFECAQCGKAFSTTHKRKFCSKECREKGCRKKIDHVCPQCNKGFRDDPRRTYCCIRCANRAKAGNGQPTIAAGNCPNCGDDFARVTWGSGKATPRFCSKYCRNAHDGRNRRSWRRAGRVGKITKINLATVYKMDGGRCQICKRKVDMNAKKLSKTPTIDHIIPSVRTT